MEWFEEDWDQIGAFVKEHQLEGIELGLTKEYDLSKIPKELIEGVHLKFYPMWVDFWKGDLEKVKGILGGEEEVKAYYGGLEPSVLVSEYKEQYERAKALGAKYMVFHISECPPEAAFSWQFDYNDEEVMNYTLELVNQAFPKDEEGPMLLFENLWWPGLTYLNPSLAKKFLEKVQYPNKGYLVDLSHLILTTKNIDTEEKAYHYIKKVMDYLGDLKKHIYGVHINKTLPKYYMKQNQCYKLEKYQKASNKMLQGRILREHIQKMDPHLPYDHPSIQKIIECIKPQFVVYETNPTSRHEMGYFIKKQNQNLGVMYEKR
jgi:hypothetical protein